MVKLMDGTGLGVLCNMDGGFGKTFDENMKTGEPFVTHHSFCET